MSVDSRTPMNQQAPLQAGPAIAKVVSHLDRKFNGSLQVEIMKMTGSGNLPSATGQLRQVKYCPPFFGQTPLQGTSNNEGFNYTQKSYGMWAIPPDPGTLVLCLFVEDNPKLGYYIGCLPDEYMDFMVPGNASTKFNSLDNTKSIPVGEFNKRTEHDQLDTTKRIKPANTDAWARLQRSGLATDTIRGTNTSSARRDLPSMVFGWSTPGPADRRPGAPTTRYGSSETQAQFPSNRLGGSVFVMDDGDPNLQRKTPASEGPPIYANVELGERGDPTLLANDSVRIQTRQGHQILLHNTEDLIYIAHGSGNSWVEMTANGRIDVYSSGSVNIHSDGDLNLDAGGNVNIGAKGSINLSAPTTNTNNVGITGNLDVSSTVKASTISGTNVKATHPHLQSGGQAGSPTAPTAPGTVPGHEPWDGHENLHDGTTGRQSNGGIAGVASDDTFSKRSVDQRS